MKHRLIYTLSFLLVCLSSIAQTIQYISPKPDSKWNALETEIIIRPGETLVNPILKDAPFVSVTGSFSGQHTGNLILSTDGKTLIFKPDSKFAPGEQVQVRLNEGLKTLSGKPVPTFTFQFSTIERTFNTVLNDKEFSNAASPAMKTFANVDSLPSDYPAPVITNLDNPSPGYFILAPYGDQRPTGAYGNYLMVLDSNGKTIKYKYNGSKLNNINYNFKQNQNGLLGFVDRNPNMTAVKILDSTLSVIDTYPGGNGKSWFHGNFELLPNGHTILMMFDSVLMDLSKSIKGGKPNAKVLQSIIQELDLNKNIVFQWRSLDYIPVTDSYDDSTSTSIDHVHMNNVIIDTDGNFLASNRYLSEITKINHETGEIMWRMGGKKNQFTFIGEHQENAPAYFSFQHDIRRLPNGNITLYDNGNLRNQKYSRAVEYKLDEINKTATLVWEYRHTPDIYANSNGNVQRLANGNTLVCWGNVAGAGTQTLTELHPDNSVALELTLPEQVHTMYAFKIESFNPSIKAAAVTREVFEGNSYSFNDSGRYACTKMLFNQLDRFFYSMVHVYRYEYAPLNAEFNGKPPLIAPVRFVMIPEGIISFQAEIRFVLNCFDGITDPAKTVVYVRANEGSGEFTSLTTQYDAVKNELVVVTDEFGEFIFGIPSTATAPLSPLLLSPENRQRINQTLPLMLHWASRGYSTAYQLQIAKDSSFQNTIVDNSTLTTTSYKTNALTLNTTYYWRIKSFNEAGESDWSEVRRFTAVTGFIQVQFPNGGEWFAQGGSYVVRWDKNVDDYINIHLHRNGIFVASVKDTVQNTGAYLWSIPSGIPIDSTYQIQIESINDHSLLDVSDKTFAISNPVLSVSPGTKGAAHGFYLGQNYPNPFSESTMIDVQSSEGLHSEANDPRNKISFTIYDVFGREVADLSDQVRNNLTLSIQNTYLPAPGVYLYRLIIGSESHTRMMIYVK